MLWRHLANAMYLYVCGGGRTYDRDSEEAMKRCRALLTDPDCDRAVRYGDIYAMMAEHYARRQQWKAVSNSNNNNTNTSKRNLGLFVYRHKVVTLEA